MLAKMKKKQVCQNAPPLSCKASGCTGSNAGVVIVYFYNCPVWRSFLGSYRRFQRNGDDECHGLLLSVLVLAQLGVDIIKRSCRGGEGKDTCRRGMSRKKLAEGEKNLLRVELESKKKNHDEGNNKTTSFERQKRKKNNFHSRRKSNFRLLTGKHQLFCGVSAFSNAFGNVDRTSGRGPRGGEGSRARCCQRQP